MEWAKTWTDCSPSRLIRSAAQRAWATGSVWPDFICSHSPACRERSRRHLPVAGMARGFLHRCHHALQQQHRHPRSPAQDMHAPPVYADEPALARQAGPAIRAPLRIVPEWQRQACRSRRVCPFHASRPFGAVPDAIARKVTKFLCRFGQHNGRKERACFRFMPPASPEFPDISKAIINA